jgi:hypothetical protein
MKAKSSRIGIFADTTTTAVSSWLPLMLIAALASALALYAVLYGPEIRKRTERLQAEQIDRENRALCGKLGMPHGSERFGVCADLLGEVRRLEAERISSEVAGIL